MQAELADLEAKLAKCDRDSNDISKGLASWEVPRSWHKLHTVEGKEHLRLVNEIKDKLEQYSTHTHLCLPITD
jgi:hypothetical protein